MSTSTYLYVIEGGNRLTSLTLHNQQSSLRVVSREYCKLKIIIIMMMMTIIIIIITIIITNNCPKIT